MPSGPLRESLQNVKKYDAVFLNGNGENTLDIINNLKNIKNNFKNIKNNFKNNFRN